MPGVPSAAAPARATRLAALLALLTAPCIAACSPIGLGIGAAATVAVTAVQERSMIDAAKDAAIQVAVNEQLLENDLTLFGKTSVSVVEGRVLITGAVRDPRRIPRAAELAWGVPGVRDVYNELQVLTGDSTVDFGRDTYINSKLRGLILRDRVIDDINYTIDVSRGTVYLIGIAQTQGEIDRIVAYAKDIAGVRGVVSYVMVKDDPRRKRLN